MGAKSLRSAESQLQAGGFLGGYKIKRFIAEGGMGAVYEAEEVGLQRRVAIKVIREDLIGEIEVRNRFVTEAKALARLNHPNIVQVYGLEEAEGRPYIIMEYIEGIAFNEILESLIIPPENAVCYFKQVLKGLAHLHDAKILHRDIKPSNLVLLKNGSVKIVDLGIAKSMDELSVNNTQAATILGTPQWLAPELYLGAAANPQTDIWSLGTTLFTAIFGRHPYFDYEDRPLIEYTDGKLRYTKEQRKFVTEELRFVLEKACEKDPMKRYRTCHEMYTDLSKVESSMATGPFTTEVYFFSSQEKRQAREFMAKEGHSEFTIRWLSFLSLLHGLHGAQTAMRKSDHTLPMGQEDKHDIHFNSEVYQQATQSYRGLKKRGRRLPFLNSKAAPVILSVLLAAGLWHNKMSQVDEAIMAVVDHPAQASEGVTFEAESLTAVSADSVTKQLSLENSLEVTGESFVDPEFVAISSLDRDDSKNTDAKLAPKPMQKEIKKTQKKIASTKSVGQRKKLLRFTADGLANAPQLKWRNVSGATEYKVQISRDKKFGELLFEKTVNALSYRWWRVKPGRVYWRVLALDLDGRPLMSSKVQSLWTHVPAPGVGGSINKVMLIENKRDLRSKNNSTVKLQWKSTNRAALYRYEVYKEGGREALIQRTTSESEAWVSLPSGSYSYRVIALNNEEEVISKASQRAKISVQRKVQLQ